jgi:hypothetical protein
MPVPTIDAEARRAALGKAMDARRLRADLKVALKSGEHSMSHVLALAATCEAVANMRVIDVLSALPAYGPTRAADLMGALSIAPSRRVRGLGPRQRAALVAAFPA